MDADVVSGKTTVSMRVRRARSPERARSNGLAPGGTSLLSGVTCRNVECGVKACIVEADRRHRHHESIPLSQLARMLWPDVDQFESLFRKLRFLYDTNKRDFLLSCERDMIFVRSDFVRAVVEQNRVLFLGNDNPTFITFLEELTAEMQDNDYLRGREFNLWIVECIVCANVTLHTLRLQVMQPVATRILDNIKLDRCEDAILQLYPVKMALTTFIEQLRPLVHCLSHGVEDERESRERMRDRRRIDSDYGSVLSHGSHVGDKHGLEKVLDDWVHNAEELVADATELSTCMDDAIRFLEASMSCMRNRLLQLELITEVATLVIGLGALVSGIFGMNLKSGIEDAKYYFHAVVIGIIACGALIALLSFWAVRRSKRHYQDHSARFGNNKFFRSLGDDAYIMSLGTAMHDGALHGDALERALQDLSEPALPIASLAAPNSFRRGSPRPSSISPQEISAWRRASSPVPAYHRNLSGASDCRPNGNAMMSSDGGTAVLLRTQH